MALQETYHDAAAFCGRAFPAGVTLDDFLDRGLKYPQFRRQTAFLLGTFLRRKKFLDGVIGVMCRKLPPRDTFILMEIALAQMFFASGVEAEKAAFVAVELASARHKALVNAVLRRALAEWREGKWRTTDAPEDVLPPSVLQSWRKTFSGEELASLAKSFLTLPDFTFRSVGGALGEASAALPGAESIASPAGSWHFYRTSAPAAVIESSLLAKGKIYIQDPATVAAVGLLSGSEEIHTMLDLCAAPGGKSLLLRELYPAAKLVACDASPRRRELLRENFRRYQAANAETPDDFPPEERKFDLVLLDAPCSNTGVFRRRPDALWRYSDQSVSEAAALQAKLLDDAAARTKENGFLLYSTCSIEDTENRRQIEDFLGRRRGFEMLNSVSLLPSDEHDGAFGALLKRHL